jgi:hypothetical protein
VERQLVERAQQGDPEAFDDRLTELIMDRLFSVAYRILRHTQSGEDATQQALVAIWRALPQLRDPDRFEAWSGSSLGPWLRGRGAAAPSSPGQAACRHPKIEVRIGPSAHTV